MRQIVSLSLAAAVMCSAQVTFPSLNTSPWLGQELLGRVSASSATVNVALDKDAQVYVEFGTSPGIYTARSATQTASAGVPLNIELKPLAANTRYYYRLQFALSPATTSRKALNSSALPLGSRKTDRFGCWVIGMVRVMYPVDEAAPTRSASLRGAGGRPMS